MPKRVTAVKKSPKPQRCGGVQGGARGGMGGRTDRRSACEWARPRALPRKGRSGPKVGNPARARNRAQATNVRAAVIRQRAKERVFGVFSVFGHFAIHFVHVMVNPAVSV